MRKLLAMILLGVASSVVLVVSVKPAAADPALVNDIAITRTFEQSVSWHAKGTFNGTSKGWSIADAVPNQDDHTVDQSVVWPLFSPLVPPERGRNLLLIFILSCTSAETPEGSLGHFRLSYTTELNPTLDSFPFPMTPDAIISTDSGVTFSVDNQDILVGGDNPGRVIYEVQFVLRDVPDDITGFRLDVFDENGRDADEFNGLPTGGPGRASNGNFALVHVTVNFFYVTPAPRVPPGLAR